VSRKSFINSRYNINSQFFLLVPILIVASYLRVHNLFDQAYLTLDDQYYSQWGIEFIELFRAGGETGNLGQGAAKMGWTLATAFSQLVFGTRPYALLLVSAFMGIVSIPVVYVLGKRWFSQDIGMVSAVLLSGSLYHIHWSRHEQPQTMAILFGLLSLLAYSIAIARHRIKWLIMIAGAMAGFTLTLHLSLAVYPFILVLMEAKPCWDRKIWTGLKRTLWICIAVATPLIAMESVVRVMRLLVQDGSVVGSPIGHMYADMTASRLDGGACTPNPGYFPGVLWEIEGVWFGLSAAIGCLIVLLNRVKGDKYETVFRPSTVIVLCYIVTFLYTTSCKMAVPRYVAPLLPVAVLAAAVSFSVILRYVLNKWMRERWWHTVLMTCCFLLLALGYLRGRDRINMSTGYEEVWSYLAPHVDLNVAFNDHPGPRHFSGSWVNLWNVDELANLDPMPQIAVLGSPVNTEAHSLTGFSLEKTIPLRVPSSHWVLPTEQWSHNYTVRIYWSLIP